MGGWVVWANTSHVTHDRKCLDQDWLRCKWCMCPEPVSTSRSLEQVIVFKRESDLNVPGYNNINISGAFHCLP